MQISFSEADYLVHRKPISQKLEVYMNNTEHISIFREFRYVIVTVIRIFLNNAFVNGMEQLT